MSWIIGSKLLYIGPLNLTLRVSFTRRTIGLWFEERKPGTESTIAGAGKEHWIRPCNKTIVTEAETLCLSPPRSCRSSSSSIEYALGRPQQWIKRVSHITMASEMALNQVQFVVNSYQIYRAISANKV